LTRGASGVIGAAPAGIDPRMSEHEEHRPDEDTAATPAEGEPGREEVAGARGGQPGYDLDEGAAYEDDANEG